MNHFWDMFPTNSSFDFQKYFKNIFLAPWAFVFGPEILISFFALFIHFKTIALDRDIDVINNNKLVEYNLDNVWFVFAGLTIINYTLGHILEKTNSRYFFVFYWMNIFLVLFLVILTINSYFAL